MIYEIFFESEVFSLTETLFVGIDVSKLSNTVRCMDFFGDSLFLKDFPNDRFGAEDIRDSIKYVILHSDFTSVVIGMESTSVYAEPLASFLQNDSFLLKWNAKVFILNPKQIKNFKNSYPELPKTDNIDSLIIADFLRFRRPSNEVVFDEKYVALRSLTRARFQLAQNLSREKSRFLNTLFYKFSNLDSSKVFSNTFGATSLAVITDFFSVDEINDTSLEQLTNFIAEKGKNHFANPELVAKELKAAARGSYRLSKVAADSINQLLAVRIAGIRSLQKQITEMDKAISAYMELFPKVLLSIPGIGPVYSAGIIAEIGNIKRFQSHNSLAKYAGLSWTKYQSGKFESDNTRLINSGNRYLKYYLLEAANKVRMHDTTFKNFYSSKLKEVPKHQHKRALALTARKLVRLVYSLLNTNRLYTPPT